MTHSNEQPAALRMGHVTEYDAGTHSARVFFPELGLVSHWLPVLVHNTLKNHDETHLDTGEHVACLISGSGAEAGIILGAFYDAKNKPPVHDAQVRAVSFEDGTCITYDRESHKLEVSCQGDIEIVAKGNIKFTATRIDLN